MVRTVQFVSSLPKADADALNAESGRVYTDMLVRHYRLYRKQGIWLTQKLGERLEDALGGPTTLHAHSRDAAQQSFYKACKTARAWRDGGLEVKYPDIRKRWRTTIWKAPKGIRLHAGTLLLGRARGVAPVQVPLPSNLLPLPTGAFLVVRLVWDRAARHYTWHVVIEDGKKPAPQPPGDHTAAVESQRDPSGGRDLRPGNRHHLLPRAARQCAIHGQAPRPCSAPNRPANARDRAPFVACNGARVVRLSKQKSRARDMELKISRAVVKWAKERQVSTLVIGDVRDVADGKRLKAKSQQKIGLWSHGRQRQYLTYKANASGMAVTLVEEAYTSQTCPATLPDGTGCGTCGKPEGRVYRCPACGFTAHRDGVGCASLLSQHFTGEPGHVVPPKGKSIVTQTRGKRSRLDTADPSRIPTIGRDASKTLRGLTPQQRVTGESNAEKQHIWGGDHSYRARHRARNQKASGAGQIARPRRCALSPSREKEQTTKGSPPVDGPALAVAVPG